MKIGEHRPANIRSVWRLFRTPFAASQLNTNMASTASATETQGKGFARLMVWRFSTLLISLSQDGAECTPRAEHSSPSQPTGTAQRSLSLPIRWRFLLLSRYAARAGFVTQRQTFVRRCQ